MHALGILQLSNGEKMLSLRRTTMSTIRAPLTLRCGPRIGFGCAKVEPDRGLSTGWG